MRFRKPTRAASVARRLARRVRTLLSPALALLLASAAPASFAAPAPRGGGPVANASPAGKSSRAGGALVMYQDEAGNTVCRAAKGDELRNILEGREGGDKRLIYSGAPLLRTSKGDVVASPLAAMSAADTPGLALVPSAGLHIFLHGTAQLEQNQEAKNAFIVAANRWEALISTPINVVIDVDYGTTFFGSPFGSSNIIGATGTSEMVNRLSDVRQRLLDNSPTAAEQTLYNALPTGAVPTELNGSTFNSTTVRMVVPNGRALGLAPDITNPNSLDIETDAGIGFNSAFGFDFNPNDGITSGQTDFDAVATHEIGHALGFASEAGGPIYASASMWDLFRFRPGAANVGNFGSAPRVMSAGGTQVYFNGQTNTFGTQELALSTGGPDGQVGDKNQSSHWKADELNGVYIGIMDPTIAKGVREVITNNDVKALDSFGYSVGASVPHPAPPPAPPTGPPINDNFASAVILSGANGTVNGDNTGATRQSGEPAHPASPGGRSVWYFWTAPASGDVTFDTEGSAFDTILAVYTGAFGSLTRVAANDDIVPGSYTSSQVKFTATAGVTYRIAVDGFVNDSAVGAEFGVIQLNWLGSSQPPAFTIQFAAASYSAFERDRSAGILVTRTNVDLTQLEVNFTAQGDPSVLASGGSQHLVFAPGEAYKIVALGINDDTQAEPDAVITLTLSDVSGVGAALGSPSSATLTVVDDDTFPANAVQFDGAALRSVGEGDGKIDLTVTRSGDLSQAASVTYATRNGVAIDTRDYTFARGVLRFGPGEASKSISVLVTDDAYDEPDESFSVELLSPVGTSVPSLGNSIVTVQILDNDAQNGPTRVGESAFFVRQHYADFFNREPDAPGLAFWIGEIEQCGSNAGCREVKRINVSAAFFLSIEFQETGYLVERTYKAAFGDATNSVTVGPGLTSPISVPVVKLAEFLPDTFSIGQGVQVGVGAWQQQLEANKQAFFAEFVTRGRFKTALPAELTPEQVVDRINANAGGVLTQGERDALVAQLSANNTAQGRAAVLRQVAENPKLRANELNRAFVLMQYFGYLRRDPDSAPDTNFTGWKFWLDKLNQFNGNFVQAEMVKAFLDSGEYRNRFGL